MKPGLVILKQKKSVKQENEGNLTPNPTKAMKKDSTISLYSYGNLYYKRNQEIIPSPKRKATNNEVKKKKKKSSILERCRQQKLGILTSTNTLEDSKIKGNNSVKNTLSTQIQIGTTCTPTNQSTQECVNIATKDSSISINTVVSQAVVCDMKNNETITQDDGKYNYISDNDFKDQNLTNRVVNTNGDLETLSPMHVHHNSKGQLKKSKESYKTLLQNDLKAKYIKVRETSVKERKPLINHLISKANYSSNNGVEQIKFTPETAIKNRKKTPVSNDNHKKNIKVNMKAFPKNDVSEYFTSYEEKPLELSNEEKTIYGSRELKNYKKIKLLGKGGCAIVWLGVDQSGNEYAMKQISKKNRTMDVLTNLSYSSLIARREIEILSYLNSQSSKDNSDMISLYDSIEDNHDIWLIFEKGGRSLSTLTFKIKGEFFQNERIYTIQKGIFLGYMIANLSQFKFFFKRMLTFVDFLTSSGIVHGDLKPDNILITYDAGNSRSHSECEFDISNAVNFQITSIKVIDFGSAFYLNNPENFSSNTPEYMSPEITELLEKNVSSKEMNGFLKRLIQWPWCIDIWSLGVTILEMILSCPMWMSYKAKVNINGKTIFKTGLFGVHGRNGNKIHSKQIEVSTSIPKLLQECLISDEGERQRLGDLLTQMLDMNYKNRISPKDALNHSFFQE